ncbi:MAG: hypothetical protein M1821_000043 [Bathelium mastoideum]|nr:MAG: hypothetical protein M1821_000043 [Bathelium mastoideum]KAI9687925.1 MAG: hypothetical protein M1822_002007 [Bathelium mastoideum]
MAKRKEVIDLTGDMEGPVGKRARSNSPWQKRHEEKQTRKADSATEFGHIDNDERLARELQAQFDLETPNPAQQSPSPTDFGDMGHERSLLQAYVQGVQQVSCAGCRKAFVTEEKDVLSILKQWLGSGSEHSQNKPQQLITGGFLQSWISEVNSALMCPRVLCLTTTCLGCGDKCSTRTHRGEAVGVRDLVWCCDSGRLFLIWALLCGFDRRQSNLNVPTKLRSSQSQPVFQGRQTSGVGYGGDSIRRPWKKYGVKAQSDPEDSATEKIMSCLTALLPSLTCENPTVFDLDPPPVLRSILIHSKLLNKVAELLRNDSLEDATQRLSLYQVALKFVGKLGSHPSTAGATIHCERPEIERGADLLQLSFSYSLASSGKNKAPETNQSIAACLASFDRQSKLMVERSKSDPNNFTAKDSKDMLTLCYSVSGLSDFLLANSGRSFATTEVNESSVLTRHESWHGALALVELPDAEILKSYCLADEAFKIDKPPLGRMKALSLELARLTTGLPPGIFVRHCSSRLDIMKALIIGPKGTPYENGLFEFDLLCGKTFPNEPPKMQFKTTAGGKIRFNPNLYADGKVCLSLLGTWSGEPWQPGCSTILQVLLSIQAMIFCEEPWCNEPGREYASGSQSSQGYNRTVQEWTVQHAVVDWLNQIDNDGLWSDIIVMHFQTSASEILTKVEEWGISHSAREQLRDGLRRISVS